ncbi:MAG: CoA-binding protein [Firmicutes bacterium]|nr:CoA-binding protein [Bacillota bacterium]
MDLVTKVNEFLAQKKLAVIGVSREGDKVSNQVVKNLRRKGYQVFPVNPKADQIDGETCYPSVAGLPEKVGGVVLVIPPEETEKVVRDLDEFGIKRVWMQPGAESFDAIEYCESKGINAVYGNCIMVLSKNIDNSRGL